MGHITVTQTIDAPQEDVFAYVDDHTNTTRYMKDLTKWAPVGDQTHGKGAHFEVAMKAGPATLDSDVLITEWTENRVIGWESQHGTFRQDGRWSFRKRGDTTEATLDMEYAFPGGIAGRLLAKAAEPIVRRNLEISVRQLKEQTEARAKRGKGSAR